jgi:TonB family protein
MTAASFLRDFIAFSVQIALVGLGIAMLLKLVKLPAGIRYTGLRLALVASLVAPWLLRTPEVQAPALALTSVSEAQFSTPIALMPPAAGPASLPPAPAPTVPWLQVGFGALLIGIAARLAWLGMGIVRLLRLKRDGVVVDAPEYSELQERLGTRATIAQVTALPQPATFGVRRPIVLLPDTLADASSSLRRAVVAHELFHVRRRDWLSVLAEEAVRTALWFHPAVLWMTSQIQLAREEIVDELTVQATGDRRTYVEALLAFADTPGLSPAPAFAQRRQLFHRILSVSKERVMSRPRMLSSAAVLLATVAGAGWYASTLFPIVKAAKADVQARTPAAGPQATSAGSLDVRTGEVTLRGVDAVALLDQRNGEVIALVTPENPIPRRTRGVVPVRPSQFSGAHVVVISRVTLDRNGAVTAVVPDGCSGTDGRNGEHVVCAAFFDSVATAIRQWRYDRPAKGPMQFYVTVTFRPGAEPTVTQSSETASSLRGAQDSVRVLAEQRRRDSAAPDDLLRAEAEIERARAEIERVNNQSRELERAQNLVERGLLSQSDFARMQAELDQLNAARARAEAQSPYTRSQQTDEILKAQLDALTAQFREIERAQRSAIERGSPNPDMVKVQRDLLRLYAELGPVQAQLREANSPRVAEAQALAEQTREAARRFEEMRAQQAADDQARAEAGVAAARAQTEAATERLREAQRKLEMSRRQPEQTTSAALSQEPPPAGGSSRPLVSPSGRAPQRTLGPDGKPIPGLQMPIPTKSVKPTYPLEAMEARLQGTAVVEALVDERGRVADARLLRGFPQFERAAVDAATQWEFRPATLNGEAVPVLVVLEMHFTLK